MRPLPIPLLVKRAQRRGQSGADGVKRRGPVFLDVLAHVCSRRPGVRADVTREPAINRSLESVSHHGPTCRCTADNQLRPKKLTVEREICPTYCTAVPVEGPMQPHRRKSRPQHLRSALVTQVLMLRLASTNGERMSEYLDVRLRVCNASL